MQIIISEEQYRLLVETDFIDQVYNKGKEVAGKFVDVHKNVAKNILPSDAYKAVSTGAKKLYDTAGKTLQSDWWYLVPGISSVKLTADVISTLRKMGKQTFYQNMEMIREGAASAAGIGVAVALDVIGAGEIINPAFWICFLVYDIWLWASKGIKNLFNIFIDIIGAVTAGASTKWGKALLGKLGKWLSGNIASAAKGMAKETPALFKFFKNAVGFFSKMGGMVTNFFKVTVPKLIQKMPILKSGLLAMEKGLGKIQQFAQELTVAFGTSEVRAIGGEVAQSAEHGLGGEAAHGAHNKLGHTAQHYGKHYAQHQIAHEVGGKLFGHGGHEGAKHIPKLLTKGKQIVKPNPILTTRNTGYKYPNKNIA